MRLLYCVVIVIIVITIVVIGLKGRGCSITAYNALAVAVIIVFCSAALRITGIIARIIIIGGGLFAWPDVVVSEFCVELQVFECAELLHELDFVENVLLRFLELNLLGGVLPAEHVVENLVDIASDLCGFFSNQLDIGNGEFSGEFFLVEFVEVGLSC